MQSIKSESDITSLAPSSPPRSPKRTTPVLYYVQSPSRESHDGEKFSVHATSSFVSPMESPSHTSIGRHSRNSSSTRFSGIFRSAAAGKFGGKPNDKGWPECKVIVEEGKYDEFGEDDDGDRKFRRRWQAVMAICMFVALFTVFCLIIWGAARPYEAEVAVRSLLVENMYIGSGADFTGVPTNMLNVNGSLRISIYNPATFYGIHVGASPVDLLYLDVVVATGEMKKYYQPRRSRRSVMVRIEGKTVPLYGAGSSLLVGENGVVNVPLTLDFKIRSRGEVVGKLVRVVHTRRVSCALLIDSDANKPIKFTKHSCNYTSI